MPKPTIACVTMQRRDSLFLNIWRRYYGREVGQDNLFVVSHGTSEGIEEDWGNHVTIPYQGLHEHFDAQRWRYLSQFASSLTEYYDFVICGDVDELICPDPAAYQGLPDYLEQHKHCDVITPFGLELVHMENESGVKMFLESVLNIRRYVVPHGAYSKPSIISRGTTFGAGGHNLMSDNKVHYSDDCFNFHLRFFDEGLLRARLGLRSREYAETTSYSSNYRRKKGRNLKIGEYWSKDDENSETLTTFKKIRSLERNDKAWDIAELHGKKQRWPRSRLLGEQALRIPEKYCGLF